MAVIYLLDTNACIHFLNNTHQPLVKRMLAAGPRELAVSTITVAELHFGAARSSRHDANVARLQTFLDEIGILAFSIECAQAFGRIKAGLVKTGKVIADLDLAIAASALAHGCVVVTDDADFSRISGLSVENWTGRTAKPIP